MSFKSEVENDIKRTFLNLEEFAEMHVINDVSVPCVIDSDMVTYSGDTKGHRLNDVEGIFLEGITVYVDSKDVDKPVTGELMYVDEKMYVVRTVKEDCGVLTIGLEMYSQ